MNTDTTTTAPENPATEDKPVLDVVEITEFHCCSEWHHGRMSPNIDGSMSQAGAAASMVYHWVLRIARKDGKTGTRRMWISAKSAAQHLNMRLRMAQLAFQLNRENGFFVLLQSGKLQGSPSLYQVLEHREWAEKHPGCCAQRHDARGDRDHLGVDLFTASDGEIKFKPFQVARYRKTGLSAEVIVRVFKAWLPVFAADNHGKPKKYWKRNVPFEFGEELDLVEYVITKYPDQLEQIIRNVAQGRSHGDGLILDERDRVLFGRG